MARSTNWPQLNPGKLRHAITLLEQVNTNTDISGVVTSYAPATPPVIIYADIEYLRGDEVVKMGLDVSQTYLSVITWFHPAFQEKKRVLAPDGATYIIQLLDNKRLMNIAMELTCQKILEPTS